MMLEGVIPQVHHECLLLILRTTEDAQRAKYILNNCTFTVFIPNYYNSTIFILILSQCALHVPGYVKEVMAFSPHFVGEDFPLYLVCKVISSHHSITSLPDWYFILT